MTRFFRQLFYTGSNVLDWFYLPGLFAKKGGDLLLLSIIIGGVLIKLCENNHYALAFTEILFYFVSFLLLFVSSFKYFILKPPRFLLGNCNDPSQFFKQFSHLSYLYGITVLSFYLSIFILGVITSFKIFFPEDIQFNFKALSNNLFFLTATIFTIMWFAYHQINETVSVETIKVRLEFYLAIAATFTVGLFEISYTELLKPMLSFLGLGFAWLKYFSERIELEKRSLSNIKNFADII